MANPGYQDWGRYNVPSSDNIFSEAPGPQTFWFGPAVDCSPWSWVMLAINNPDPGVIIGVTVSWAGYTSIIEDLISESICIGGSTTAIYVMPTRGRTVQLQYSVLAGTPVNGVTYIFSGLSHLVSKYDIKQNVWILLSSNVAMGVNSTSVLNITPWYEGPITLTMSGQLGGAALATLSQYDRISNSWVDVGRYGVMGDTTAAPYLISLGPAPARITVFNGPTAQNVRVFVTARSAL